eukprot:6485656-Amphidinium_carterae.1
MQHETESPQLQELGKTKATYEVFSLAMPKEYEEATKVLAIATATVQEGFLMTYLGSKTGTPVQLKCNLKRVFDAVDAYSREFKHDVSELMHPTLVQAASDYLRKAS